MKPERTIPHLELRPSGYFWRRRLPKKFSTVQTPVLRLSLKTQDPVQAVMLARRLTRLSSLLLEAGSADMKTSEMHSLITETLAREVRAADQQRAVAPPRTRAEAAQEQRQLDALVATRKEAILLRDYSLVHTLMRTTARNLGIAADEASLEWRSATHQTFRGLLDVTQDRLARDRGEFDEPSVFFRSARNQARPEGEIRSLAHSGAAPAAFASQSVIIPLEINVPEQAAKPAAASFATVPSAVEAVAASTSVISNAPSVPFPATETSAEPPVTFPLQDKAVVALPKAHRSEPSKDERPSEVPSGVAVQPVQVTAPIGGSPHPSQPTSFPAAVARSLALEAQAATPDAVAQALAVLAAHRGPSPSVRDVAAKYLAHLEAGYSYSRPADETVATGERRGVWGNLNSRDKWIFRATAA